MKDKKEGQKMNIFSFKNYFYDAPESASKLFSFIFKPNLFKEFYISKDYESMSHMIRRILEPHSKYGSNLKLFCSCMSREVFYSLCTALAEKKRTMSDEKVFESVLNQVSAEVSEDSKLLKTMKLLKKNESKQYATEIFLMLGVLYSIFGQYYSHFESLYDISDSETYELIYKEIIPSCDVTDCKCYDYAEERKENTYFTDKCISDFLNSNISSESREITIASLSGEIIFSREIMKTLVSFLKSGGRMNVILTSPSVSGPIISKMDSVEEILIDPEYIYSVWKKLSEKYDVDLSLTNVPVFHNIVCLDDTDMHVCFYTYPGETGYKQLQLELKKDDEYYNIFYSELNMLKETSCESDFYRSVGA